MTDENQTPPVAAENPPPSGEEPVVTEQPGQAKPTPEQEAANRRAQERIEEARAYEARAAEQREREQWQRQRGEFEAEQARFKAEREAWQRQQQAEREAILKGGPDALKARLGIDMKELNQAWIAESDPAYQAQLQTKRELEELRKKTEEYETWRKSEEARAAQARAEEGMRSVLSALDSQEETYPHAWALTEGEQRMAIAAAAASLREEGAQLTMERVLKRVDEGAKRLHDERQKRQSMRKTSSTPGSGATPGTSSSPGNRSETRTLTGKDAGQKNGERKLTEDEQEEIFRQQLRDAMKADEEKLKKARA